MNNSDTRLPAHQVKWEPINFFFYFSFAKWPILIAAVAEVILRFLSIGILDGLLFGTRLDLLVWPIRIAVFIYLGYKIFKNYGEVPAMGAFAGVVSGTILGLLVSLSRFIEGFRVWKVFNLVTETVVMAVVGCLIVFIIVYVWDLIPNFKKK